MKATGPHAYRAELLRPGHPDEAARILALSRTAGYEVVDSLAAQVADLVQTRHHAAKLQPDEIDEAVAGILRGQGSDYGVWAHYPWARRIVRVLPQEDFVALRTNRNQHKITAAEQSRLAGKKVGIVGLSVGQSVALTLALERSCGELRIADFDVIDLSNLNRLRCGIHNIGLPKTVVAAREIAELDPYLDVICFSDGYTRDNGDAFLDGLDVVIDECDGLDMKFHVREAARAHRIPVLMNASDRGMTDIERFDIEPERPFFHGSVKAVEADRLADMTTQEKVPVVLDMIGLSTTSVRLRASMLEIGQSIKTWPQLAADVTLGGAIICDVTRRLLLGEPIVSGRYFLDLSDVGTRPSSLAQDIPPAIEARAPAARDDSDHAYDRIASDALLAPSAGNVQPWLWQRQATGLALKHRRTGQAGVLYHDDKAAMVGLGATLESALISANHRGFRTSVVLDLHGDTVASIALGEPGSGGHEPLYPQLARRRSVRTRPPARVEIADGILDAMERQVDRFPGHSLTWLTKAADIGAAAALLGDAERLRMLDPDSHADMVREIAWSDAQHRNDGEGIPLASLSLSAAEEAGLQIIRDPAVMATLAEWGLGRGLSQLTHDLVATSSAIGLLWSASGRHADYFSGGRALQRIWLEATRLDVGMCPVTSICYLIGAWRAGRPLTPEQAAEMPDIDRRFRALFGVPESRGDIALFRLLPAAEELRTPRATFRRSGR